MTCLCQQKNWVASAVQLKVHIRRCRHNPKAMTACPTMPQPPCCASPAPTAPQPALFPAAATAFVSQEQVTGQGATSMQAVKAPALAFPQGCQVTVLNEIVVRAEESLDSKVVTVLREGTLLDVLRGGFEPETRRLYVRQVRHDQSGCSGWISCIARSGHPWVSLVASVSQA
eukprot:s4361_g8.t1